MSRATWRALISKLTKPWELCAGIQVQGGEFLWQKTPSVVNNGDAVIHLTAQINSGRRSSHSVQEQCVEEVPTSAEPCKQAPQATGPMSNGFNGYIKQTMLSTSWPLHDINLEVNLHHCNATSSHCQCLTWWLTPYQLVALYRSSLENLCVWSAVLGAERLL